MVVDVVLKIIFVLMDLNLKVLFFMKCFVIENFVLIVYDVREFFGLVDGLFFLKGGLF